MSSHPLPAPEATPAPAGGWRRRALVIFGAWTAVGLYFFSQDVSRAWYWGTPTPLWMPLAMWLVAVWSLAALTPLVLWLGRRWPLDAPRGRRLRHVLWHTGASITVALVHVVAISAFVHQTKTLGALTPPTLRGAVGVMLVLSLHGNILSYWTVIAAQHAARIWRMAQEREKDALRLRAHAATLEAQLSGARLSALKAQLQPHFLFNTLNAITVLVRQRKAEQAEETLARLGDLLRLVLDDVDASCVSLRRELDYVRRYLAIEELRFADCLRVEIDVGAELLGAAVPHLGLQPLVENALRHGISRRAAASLVRVRARRAEDELILEVYDDGPGPPAPGALTHETPAGPGAGSGIGLSNTRARLRQLYGERASLTLAAGAAGGAVATMVVPFHLAAELPS